MEHIKAFLGSGEYYSVKDVKLGHFRVNNFSDIIEKIIPFFNIHKIRGVKSKDFQDWCLVSEIIKNKGHLNQEGLDQIINLKSNMNTGRFTSVSK